MVVFLHVVVALASIILATVTLFRPNNVRFAFTYGLTGTTLVSGIYLVWSDPARMLHACIAGVTYLTIVATMTLFARVRFANAGQKDSLGL